MSLLVAAAYNQKTFPRRRPESFPVIQAAGYMQALNQRVPFTRQGLGPANAGPRLKRYVSER